MLARVLTWVTQYGYFGLFFALVFGIVGLPIPDETILTFTGYLVYKHRLSFPIALAVAFFGSACGITISYVLGRTLGLGLIHRYGRYIHFTQEKLDEIHNWFHRIGRWTLTIGYFVPGVRHFTAYAAGIACMPYREFAAFAYSGAYIWALTFISLGYFFGDRWEWVLQRTSGTLGMVVIFGSGAIVCYLISRKLFKRKK